MSEDILKKWSKAILAPYGLILVTGPTGSGKTSTLYASLHQLDSKTRNIVTVEDPVEYEFDKNVAQVQVTERLTFPKVMRTFLRQDPDIIMVGEMRDPESLSIGIQAGLTGHLVLSTLHTNTAIESVYRMLDMGAEPYLVAGVTVAILAQRLVRLNCAKCRQTFTPDEDELDMLGIVGDERANAKFYKGAGCPECRGTGYKGRIGVFEMITGSPDVRAAIVHGATPPEMMELAKKQGFRSMMDDGRGKVLAGWTTPAEVLKAVYTQAVE